MLNIEPLNKVRFVTNSTEIIKTEGDFRTCTEQDFKDVGAMHIYQNTFKNDEDKSLICVNFKDAWL
jgi:hypothetical protein